MVCRSGHKAGRRTALQFATQIILWAVASDPSSSFLRKQESITSTVPRMDSCLRRNDGGESGSAAVDITRISPSRPPNGAGASTNGRCGGICGYRASREALSDIMPHRGSCNWPSVLTPGLCEICEICVEPSVVATITGANHNAPSPPIQSDESRLSTTYQPPGRPHLPSPHGAHRLSERGHLATLSALDHRNLRIQPERPNRRAKDQQRRGDNEWRLPRSVLNKEPEYDRRQSPADVAGHIHHP